MAKMKKKWIVLCSAAICVIYASEYYASNSQAYLPQLETQDGTGVQTSGSVSPSPSPSPSPNSVNRRYNDGTYTGTGSNRRGSIQVAVTVKSDKIMDVEISDFAMHYSESDVVDLPDEVLKKQSSQVDNVTGATYSTRAFEDAVADALAQAKIG